jgi:capsular exopolysaccharide synthesis family protein
VPDVQLLDSAVAPQNPTSDVAIRIILMAIVGSIGASLALAILLDRVDPRVRYPDQVTNELGLEVLGAIPTIKQSDKESARFATATQVVEAFRTVRLTLTHALQAAPPIVVTVTSPSPGDGKSLVSSNLALSFAEAGYRTLLVDGDVRRGQVHACFGIERRPGLVEVLSGTSTAEEVLRPVSHSNLTVMTCGARRSQAPELLASQGMARLIDQLKGTFDAIIIDSAPLSAGIDPYALSAVAGRVILVMKTGVTDRRTTQAKLSLMDRMPVEIVGAVLNDYRAEGAYRYYGYLDEYALEADEDGARTPLIAGVTGRPGG